MKIEKFFNKKESKDQFRARFQLNGKEFRPVADTRKKLNEIIDELRAGQHREKYDLPTVKHFRTVAELFEEHLRRLKLEGDRKKISIFKRVSEKLLDLLPPGILISQLKKAHFQKYIDQRLTEKNPQSEKFILPETVNKERSAIAVAFRNAALYFPELEDAPPVILPKAEAKKRRRERLVQKQNELFVLLEYLRQPHKHPRVEKYRRTLADKLEIRYETGLRRKEVDRLKKNQYHASEAALRDVVRWKTGTITKFFPLTGRAVEIIESRLDSDSEYLFSNNGKSDERVYQTLKQVCGKLGIPYGTHSEDGWVPHDLRRNYATRVIEHADIKTVAELLGHNSTVHTEVYLGTDNSRLKEAVRKSDQGRRHETLKTIYESVKNNDVNLEQFVRKIEEWCYNNHGSK